MSKRKYRGFVYTDDLAEPGEFFEFLRRFVSPPEPETVEVGPELSGRVLAEDVRAERPSPPFTRSAMDGYAVRSEDAEPGARLKVVGESRIGEGTDVEVGPGEAVYVDTGAPVPEGADAVIPMEFVERDGDEIVVKEDVDRGDNLDPAGCYVEEGEVLYRSGHLIEPVDVGVMLEHGVEEVDVHGPLRVSIVVTGNELVRRPSELESETQVVDCIGPVLTAELENMGCIELVGTSLVKDDPNEIREVVEDYADRSDVILITGGSSVGERDHVKDVLDDTFDAFVHGIRVRPGRPFGIAAREGTVAFTLPGWPTSCYSTFRVWVIPSLLALAGANPLVVGFEAEAAGIESKREVGVIARVRLTPDGAEGLPRDRSSHFALFRETDGFALVPPGGSERTLVLPLRGFLNLFDELNQRF
ncbi:molybdopterin molybdotransferase MoeA [Methanopyrus sp.]